MTELPWASNCSGVCAPSGAINRQASRYFITSWTARPAKGLRLAIPLYDRINYLPAGQYRRRSVKIGLYSITYRGIWYRGSAVDVFSLVRLAKEQGWEGLELDAERPHAAPMDLSGDDRKRLRDLAGELDLPLCAICPNCDLSSPAPGPRRSA